MGGVVEFAVCSDDVPRAVRYLLGIPDGIFAFSARQLGANIPVVMSSEAVVQDSFDLRPRTPGASISGTVLGNDQILCGNVASTYYVVTP
jgi:hypothetical protein